MSLDLELIFPVSKVLVSYLVFLMISPRASIIAEIPVLALRTISLRFSIARRRV